MQSNKANFDLIAAVVPKLNLKFFVCCFKQPACSNMFPPFSYYSYYKRVLRLLEKKKKKQKTWESIVYKCYFYSSINNFKAPFSHHYAAIEK